MNRRSRAGLAGLALTLTFAASACGDDTSSETGSGDSPTSAAAASISKDDFLEQGNQICADGNEALDALGADLDPSDPDAVDNLIVSGLVPNIQGQIDDLRALGYPEGDEETLEGAYTDAEDALAQIAEDPTLVSGGTADPFADANTALTDYGLTECGSSG